METTKTSNVDIHIGQSVFFRELGTTYKVMSHSVNGSAAIVEHTLEAGSLGSPVHKHKHEDEISYVLEGELSVMQNGQTHIAHPGEYIVKPRGIFHAFWNAGDKQVRFIEVITPGNFEYYFAEVAPFLLPGQPPQMDKLKAIAEKYGLTIDPEATEAVIRQFNLKR